MVATKLLREHVGGRTWFNYVGFLFACGEIKYDVHLWYKKIMILVIVQQKLGNSIYINPQILFRLLI